MRKRGSQILGVMLAVAQAAFTANASAETATSFGTLSTLSFQVIDLTPDDGIQAGYTLLQTPTGQPAGDNGFGGFVENSLVSFSPIGTIDGKANYDGMYAPNSASLSALDVSWTGSVSDQGMFLAGVGSSPTAHYFAAGTWSAVTFPNGVGQPGVFGLTLAPNTDLVVSAHATAFASVNSSCVPAVLTRCPTAYARSFIWGLSWEDVHGSSRYQEIDASVNPSLDGVSTQSFQADLRISLVNSSNAPVVYALLGGIVIDGGVSAIPEPSVYASLLIGLSLIGFVRRSSRGRSER